MSGHSHWATIRRQKASTDAKKSSIFTKIANMLTIASKQGGVDPETNFKLRLAIDKARSANMPKNSVEKAIKRGTGDITGEIIEENIYEGYGPQGTAFIIESVTTNKNRASAEIKYAFTKYEGSLGTQGSVRWMFDSLGVLHINTGGLSVSQDELELLAIDSGATDIQKEDEYIIIYTQPEALQKVQELLEKENVVIEYAEIERIAKEKIIIKEQKTKKILEKIFEALDNCEDVNTFYTNADFS